MRRRELMLLLGATLGLPRVVRAQPKAMPVIGWLQNSQQIARPPNNRATAFHQGLRETGYVEGENLTIEYRTAAGQYDRFPALAAELVARKVDVILSFAGPVSLRAAQNATSTIPIIFLSGSDPVADGFVASLARPGGNITGVVTQVGELTPKRLELLSELVPNAKVIALLTNLANGPMLDRHLREMQEAARIKGVDLPVLEASTEGEIDAAFAKLRGLNAGALIVHSDAFFQSRREQLVALEARYGIPTMYPNPEFVVSGGLISYSPSYATAFRLIGSYAGTILKGAKPADLPVQQPTAFELLINVNTAKAHGLTVPQTILARADKVIE
jgi:putative tryptophan/tyrosine transport system substrate-binding protein